jgi:hypothetical protein
MWMNTREHDAPTVTDLLRAPTPIVEIRAGVGSSVCAPAVSVRFAKQGSGQISEAITRRDGAGSEAGQGCQTCDDHMTFEFASRYGVGMWRTQSLILGITAASNSVACYRAGRLAVVNPVAFDGLSVEDLAIGFSLYLPMRVATRAQALSAQAPCRSVAILVGARSPSQRGVSWLWPQLQRVGVPSGGR